MSRELHKGARVSWSRWLMGRVDEQPVSSKTMRHIAWVRWAAVLGIWLPVNFVLGPTVTAESYRPEISLGIILMGQWLTVAEVLSNAIVHWMTADASNERHRQIAYWATMSCVVFETVSITSIQYGMGSLAILQPTLGLGIIVLYRIFCDYWTTVVCWVMVVVGWVSVGLLETAQVISPAPFFVEPLNHPYYLEQWAGVSQLWLAFFQLVGLFWAINFVSNQRASLHRYMTEYVLQRYLPLDMVERASRGELTLEGPPEEVEVTVLFADLVGFTKLSQDLGVDGIASVLDQILGSGGGFCPRAGRDGG